RRQEHVDETRAGNLEPVDLGAWGEVTNDRLGDLTRGLLGRARERHRDVGRVISVLGLARDLPRDVREGKPGRRQRAPNGLSESVRNGHHVNEKSPRLAATRQSYSPVSWRGRKSTASGSCWRPGNATGVERRWGPTKPDRIASRWPAGSRALADDSALSSRWV